MRNTFGTAVAMLVFAWGCAAAADMTKEDYKAAGKRIAAQYQAERETCGARYGNAVDICVARAHGVRDVAKAELEAAYKPGSRTNYDAAIARAKAAYALAKQECDDQKGVAKKACMKDAQAALARANADAKSARTASRAEEAAKAKPP
jgi:hypothetical protein